jgi:hypothetical protein
VSPAAPASDESRVAVLSETPATEPESEAEAAGEACASCAEKAAKGEGAEEPRVFRPSAPKSFVETSLTPVELELFLKKRQRDGESLIAAFSASGDMRYLQEAVERAPDVPEVALAALAKGWFGKDADWIQRLRKADPDNALVQFLTSMEAFGRLDYKEGLAALRQAQVLPEFDDYRASRMRLIEEAALDVGYSPEKASALAAKSADPADDLLPKYLELADSVTFLLSNYKMKPGEADSIFQAALKLGTELQNGAEGRSLYMQAGAALYLNDLFEGIAESSPLPSLRDSPAALAASAKQEKERMVQLQQLFHQLGWLRRRDQTAVVGFFQKKRELGERDAIMWALAH